MAAPVVVGMMFSAAARAAIEVLVQRVERRLVARVGVNRRHEAVLDADERCAAPCATGARQLVVHEAFETTR